jgi:hypothetical protein
MAVARRSVLTGIAAAAAARGADGQPIQVDLELALALDVSRSMDDEELELQRQGYAQAFAHPAIIQAVKSGVHGRIAVVMYEWANYAHQQVLIPWTIIDGEDASEGFSAAVLATPKRNANWTSISGAIDYGKGLFGTSGARATRRVIDISGDGVNNHGRSVTQARDEAVATGITINGLVIMNDRPTPGGWRPFVTQPLDVHYREQVIGGPGAFVMSAEDFDSFAFAIRNKLIREISQHGSVSIDANAG